MEDYPDVSHRFKHFIADLHQGISLMRRTNDIYVKRVILSRLFIAPAERFLVSFDELRRRYTPAAGMRVFIDEAWRPLRRRSHLHAR